MELNKDYKNDPRWHQVEPNRQANWIVPNAFLDILYRYKDKMPYLKDIKSAIETGTHEAYTVEFLADHFDQVFTIESVVNPARQSKFDSLKAQKPNIQFLTGDSPVKLKEIFQQKPHERFFILLDAHHGSQTPITQELEVIRDFSSRDHVIIVDDGVDMGSGNWPTWDKFYELLKQINPNYKIIKETGVNRGSILVYE